ncbi:thioredoxin family protein [Desulfocurvus sp. DL9XJH121]
MKEIKVLGTGCAKCEKLYANAEEAAKGLGIEYDLAKVTNMLDISTYGVMITPALVVDGEVKVVGKVPDPEAIAEFLK